MHLSYLVDKDLDLQNFLESRINSDTGVGATLRPILKFTRVDDANALAATSQNAVLTVIDCVQK